ncbi:hypothetical protein FK268_00765 [Tsukamurella sputi]|uniref:Uncharacterized protein n=1 Tax=Tsukamurella sputi TaxID=2591848 RepID=A0A5C5RS13_9ACTN|nr:hypothetical protein [Tsukamurella sputi]TWS25837.1 hypothetical protein FK268_00765 [Tsukamurella sputi]
METDQLFAHWLEGPEARRISAQLEGCGIGERLWAFAEAYRRSRPEVQWSVPEADRGVREGQRVAAM